MSGGGSENCEGVLNIFMFADSLSLDFNPGVGMEVLNGLVGADTQGGRDASPGKHTLEGASAYETGCRRKKQAGSKENQFLEFPGSAQMVCWV